MANDTDDMLEQLRDWRKGTPDEPGISLLVWIKRNVARAQDQLKRHDEERKGLERQLNYWIRATEIIQDKEG